MEHAQLQGQVWDKYKFHFSAPLAYFHRQLFKPMELGSKVETPETVRDQFQTPMQAHVSTSRVLNQITTTINCSSLVINYEYQVSKVIGLEMKISTNFPTNINSGLCRFSFKIQKKIIN